jgi:hypothetical protein
MLIRIHNAALYLTLKAGFVSESVSMWIVEVIFFIINFSAIPEGRIVQEFDAGLL